MELYLLLSHPFVSMIIASMSVVTAGSPAQTEQKHAMQIVPLHITRPTAVILLQAVKDDLTAQS